MLGIRGLGRNDWSADASTVKLPSDGSSSVISLEKPRFVIAIDYGTTCTGVAYGYRFHEGTDPHIEQVRSWPDESDLVKVPSDIAYAHQRPGDTQRRFEWGASVPNPALPAFTRRNRDWVILKWVKLTLEDPKYGVSDEGLPCDHARRMMREAKFGPLNPVDVVSDYLSGLWSHVMKEIDRGLANIKSRDNMEQIVVLTVPATWSIQATRCTYNAAKKANLDSQFRLHIIKEPEAAAMHILLKMEQDNFLNKYDRFIVCDAGGGTVDLVSYEIERTHPLQLRQCTDPTGDHCGSTNLDIKFQEHLRSILSPKRYSEISPRNMVKIMRSWTEAKLSFDGKSEKYIDVEVEFPVEHTDEKLGIEGGFLLLNAETMRGLFDPICNTILSLIHEQNKKLQETGRSAKAILMVGGLGRNEHLFNTLEVRYAWNSEGGSKVKVLRPDREAMLTSVCRGAVEIALDSELETTQMSPFSFGLRFQGEGISWFILQGELRTPGKSKEATALFEIESPNFSRSHVLRCDVVISQEPLSSPTPSDPNPTPAEVEELDSFSIDLPQSAHKDYPVQTVGSRKVKKVKLQLEFSFYLWCVTIHYRLEGGDLWIKKVIDYPTKKSVTAV